MYLVYLQGDFYNKMELLSIQTRVQNLYVLSEEYYIGCKSIAVMKHHNQRKLWKEGLIWALQIQRDESITTMVWRMAVGCQV